MKNFVNVNLMTHSKNAVNQLESHNKDRENIDYLLDVDDRLENYHESFNVMEDVIQIVKVSARNI